MSGMGRRYPVATYQVVDAYDNLGVHRQLIREDHPNLKLDLDLGAMTAEELNQAVSALQRALDQISPLKQRDRPERS